jgi:3-oxoacyl-[acyl-carrier protein] reductase
MKNMGQVALITGASRGIGRAIALALASQGFHIAAIARTMISTEGKPSLENLRPEVEKFGVEYLPIQADISLIKQHTDIVCSVVRQFGHIDLLVNNAGMSPTVRKDILETDSSSFDQLLAVNLRAPFFLSQVVARMMLEQLDDPSAHPSRIVFITSVSAELSSVNRAEYCISKAGLSMAAKVFADRLADTGIKVFEVRPGIILTDMTAPVKEKYDAMIAGGFIPQNRWGQPEDVARIVTAIARGDLDYSTGSIIEVSGGMNIRKL